MERIWPHIDRGEGHFCARISKPDSDNDEDFGLGDVDFEIANNKNSKSKNKKASKSKRTSSGSKIPDDLKKFFLDYLSENQFEDLQNFKDRLVENKDMIYLASIDQDKLKGLKVLRNGILLGQLKKNRFEPAHSLAMALKKSDVKHCLDLDHDSEEIYKYLEGQPIETGQSRGWVLVCVEGCSIGWGKESSGVLKNKYPKGLRRVIKR